MLREGLTHGRVLVAVLLDIGERRRHGAQDKAQDDSASGPEQAFHLLFQVQSVHSGVAFLKGKVVDRFHGMDSRWRIHGPGDCAF